MDMNEELSQEQLDQLLAMVKEIGSRIDKIVEKVGIGLGGVHQDLERIRMERHAAQVRFERDCSLGLRFLGASNLDGRRSSLPQLMDNGVVRGRGFKRTRGYKPGSIY
jgi:ABC-type phosphate transport system auxiliary subunit